MDGSDGCDGWMEVMDGACLLNFRMRWCRMSTEDLFVQGEGIESTTVCAGSSDGEKHGFLSS